MINIVNSFRGTLLIGTPGSGKSFSVVNSYIRHHSAKGFALMVYDFKFPDLANIAFYNFLMNKKKGIIPESFEFNVINFNDIEYSRLTIQLGPENLQTLADAIETATAGPRFPLKPYRHGPRPSTRPPPTEKPPPRAVPTAAGGLTSFSPSRLSTSWRPACSISPNTHVRMMTAI